MYTFQYISIDAYSHDFFNWFRGQIWRINTRIVSKRVCVEYITWVTALRFSIYNYLAARSHLSCTFNVHAVVPLSRAYILKSFQIWFQGTRGHKRPRFPLYKGHLLLILSACFVVIPRGQLADIFSATSTREVLLLESRCFHSFKVKLCSFTICGFSCHSTIPHV